jgi:hypothetical protein
MQVKGYKHVNLCKNGEQTLVAVHRIVGKAFLGPAPGLVGKTKGCWQIDHEDEDKANNAASNLRWMKAEMNNSKAHANFTPDQVRSIRRLLKQGVRQRKIAEQFACKQSTISNIKNGVVYGWVV